MHGLYDVFIVIFVLILSFCVKVGNGKWWFVSQLSSSMAADLVHCRNIPGLVRRQRKLCEKYPNMILSVADGASLAIRECQHQFKGSPWNCSTVPRDSSVFGHSLTLRSTKESAFVYSITSAAVVHSLTKACSAGQLPNCACDNTKLGNYTSRHGGFLWGGCSDNLRFATSFARRFIDAPDKKQKDIRAISNLHNNRVGRKSIRKVSKLQCKCHGLSGSCATRTCWTSLSPFRASSRWLKKRYEAALPVRSKPKASGMVVRKSRRTPRKTDLVYLEKSPDYCQADASRGMPGTGGRECNISSLSFDGCSSLCCHRGYYSEQRLVKRQCGCNFQWCCKVTCQYCENEEIAYFCNAN